MSTSLLETPGCLDPDQTPLHDMAISDISTLLENAKCFRCLSHKELIAVQTYIIAYASDQGMDPDTLLNEARCLLCLSQKKLFQIRAYLIASIGGLSTDPQELAGTAQCYRCIPDGYMEAVRAYLFSLDPNGPGTSDPATLEANASAFNGLTPEHSLAIQVYLLANNAGLSTDPNELQELAKCFDCLSFEVLNSVTTNVVDEVENDGGINGGGETPCVDIPADQVPVITGLYTDGVLTGLSILLPQVCCDPRNVTIYEADDAIGTGAVAFASGLIAASHAGEINYTLPDYIFGAAPTKAFILVTQVCDDGTESDYSNGLEVDTTCGVASNYILVEGAGDADANGVYVWDQAEFNSSGRYTYANAVSNWMIEFTDGAGGVEGYMYDDLLNIAYHLPLAECFPCGAWSNSGADIGPDPVPTCSWTNQGVERAYDWAARVVTNGGVRPAQATINSMATFYTAIYTAGIYTKFKSLNAFAPDNLTAARTPQIVGVGSDPWANSGFVAGDLTINGLIGNAAKYLDTGVNPATAFASDNTGGISMYTLGPAGGFAVECGARNATGGNAIFLYAQFGGATYWQCYANSGAGSINYANAAFTGFISGNRTAANDTKIYDANSGSAFAQRATGAANLGNRPNVGTMVAFGSNDNGTKTGYSAKRLSFLAIHDGLTSGEAQSLYNAVQALRTSLGGGYV